MTGLVKSYKCCVLTVCWRVAVAVSIFPLGYWANLI